MRSASARALFGLLLGAVVMTAAACGGGSGGGISATSSEAAGFVPADAAMFLAVGTDFESPQWQAAEALVRRFPGGGDALDELDAVTDGVGPEVGIAVLDGSEAGHPAAIVVTEPANPAKLEASLRQSADEPVWRVVDGWYVVAGDEATLDRALASGDRLAGNDRFQQAFDGLPGNAVASLYVSGAAIAKAIGESAGEKAGPLAGLAAALGAGAGAGTSSAIGVAVRAEQGGARLDGVVVGDQLARTTSFAPSFAGLVPKDALAYVSFRDARTTVETFLDAAIAQTPGLDARLGQTQLLGVGVTDDLLPLLEGEQALIVGAAAPTPQLTLLLSPADPRRALAALDELTRGIEGLASLAGVDAPLSVASVTVAGIPAKRVDIHSRDISLFYALVGDHLVITTAEQGIADTAAPAASIETDALYQEAVAAAGVPAETTGLLFVKDLVALMGMNGSRAGELEPIRYVVLYGEGGDPQRFGGFVAVG